MSENNNEKYSKKMFNEYKAEYSNSDPEFMELFKNFAFDEVVNHDNLDNKTRFMAILSTLMGCMGTHEYKHILKIALEEDVTPLEIKEIVYQANAYLGMGRISEFLKITNEVFKEKGIDTKGLNASTTTKENRREKGTEAQVEIFGKNMKDFYKSGPEETRHINYWLAANCFGDYYTRKGLNYRQREMITFCFLLSQGGCEPQLTSHAMANMKVGNDKEFLISIVSECLPFIGYPRSLNAINCVNEAYKNLKG